MELKVESNVPFPKKINKELVDALVSLNEGDSVFLNYEQFNRTIISNCVASARIRILAKGLCFKTIGEENGRRVWVFKK
jgi:hypothetical protein